MDAETQKAENGREHQKKALIFKAAEEKVRTKQLLFHYVVCDLFCTQFCTKATTTIIYKAILLILALHFN